MIRDERWKWERAGWGRGRQQMNRKIGDCKEREVAVSVSSEVERQWVVSSAVMRHLHFGINFNSSTQKKAHITCSSSSVIRAHNLLVEQSKT